MREQDRGDTMSDNDKKLEIEKDEEIEILEVEDTSISSSVNNQQEENKSTLSPNATIDNNEFDSNIPDNLQSNYEVPEPINSIQNNTTEQDNINNKNSNGKYIMTIILFIFIFLIVFFLPDISKFFSELEKNKNTESVEKITTGTLKCTLERSDEKFDYEYLSEFEFENNKFLTLDHVTTTTGDETVDRENLQAMYEKCQTLKNSINDLSGVSVTCSLNKGTFIENQVLTYASIDVEQITSAYSEAGGIYPNFKKGDNIDIIESGMKSSGYTCEREK